MHVTAGALGATIKRGLKRLEPGPEFRLRFVQSSAGLAGFLTLAGWAMLERARPQTATFFDRHLHKQPRTIWDPAFLDRAEQLIAAGLIVCLLALLVHWLGRTRTRVAWILGALGVADFMILVYCSLGR
jgi:uncharacterized membrane protein